MARLTSTTPAGHEEEFLDLAVRLANGEEITLCLAERGVCLSGQIWVREIRCLDEKGHRTPMLSSDFRRELDRVVVGLFARWCQEKFSQYISQHQGLEKLAAYPTEPIPDTTLTPQMVNPAWRWADAVVRRERALLSRSHAEYGRGNWWPIQKPRLLRKSS